MQLTADELSVIIDCINGRTSAHRDIFTNGVCLFYKNVKVQESPTPFGKYLAGTMSDLKKALPPSNKVTNNCGVICRFMEGTPARNHRGTLFTDGTTLYSFGQKIFWYNRESDIFEHADTGYHLEYAKEIIYA